MKRGLFPVCRGTFAARAAINPWLEAGQCQQLDLESAKPFCDRRIGIGIDSFESALDQFEDSWFSLLPFHHRIDQLDYVRRVRIAIEIESEPTRPPDDVGGFDEAKLVVAPCAECQSNVRKGFERTHKSALRSQGSLGNTGDLAEVSGEETYDLVALAEGASA